MAASRPPKAGREEQGKEKHGLDCWVGGMAGTAKQLSVLIT